jgi:hypothetical protein
MKECPETKEIPAYFSCVKRHITCKGAASHE